MAVDLSSEGNSSPMSVNCPHCEGGMPSNAAFCPACGWSMVPLPAPERAAAAATYLTFVAAAVFLLLPEYRTHRFVRFHAWQSVFLWALFLVLTGIALVLSNVAAAMVFLLLGILASLAMLFLWVVLTIKAWEGERFELPLLGALAGRMK
jgi:uncharacterized membrane protein